MKVIYCLVLAISTIGPSFAQENLNAASNKVFEISPDYFRLKYQVDLGKGNKLQIDLKDIKDLQHLANPDSLLRNFLAAMLALKDTMSDKRTSKRIDYVIDSAGREKIRVREYKSSSETFVLDHGDLAALKLEQDTVNFIITFTDGPHYLRRGTLNVKRYKMSFFVNQLDDLDNYHDGSLNDKLTALKENVNGAWVGGKEKNRYYLDKEMTISAEHPKGYLTVTGVTIGLGQSINLQNYKNYFVPSFRLGGLITVSNSFFKHEIGIYWEPNFFFAKNNQDKIQTYRNDFLTVVLAHGFVKNNDPRNGSNLLAIFSYGYLIRRSGDFVTKHTSRFGIGSFTMLADHMKIEPGICFNDFFKGVTPSLRATIGF